MEELWDIVLQTTGNNCSVCMFQTSFMTSKYKTQSGKSKICSVRV